MVRGKTEWGSPEPVDESSIADGRRTGSVHREPMTRAVESGKRRMTNKRGE